VVNPTDPWAHRIGLLLGIALAACSPRSAPFDTYQHVWAEYASGNLPRAAADCAQWADQYRDPNDQWFWQFRLLRAEVLTAQGKSGEAVLLLRTPVPGRTGLLEARRLVDLAALERDSQAAKPLLEGARNLTHDTELVIRAHIVEGVVAYRSRKLEEAYRALGVAAQMAHAARMAYWEAQALSNQSTVARNLGRYEAAVDFSQRALDIAEHCGCRRLAAQAHGSLGTAYFVLGDGDRALNHEAQAVSMQEAIGDRDSLTIALGEIGLMYDSQGLREKAIASYQRAYEIASQLGRTRDAARHAENLAFALINGEEWERAAEWNDRAGQMAAQISAADMIPYLTRNRARIAQGQGQRNEAARICQELLGSQGLPASLRWEIYARLGIMDAEAKRFKPANTEFESALRIIEGRRSDLVDAQFRMTLLSRLIPFYQDYVDALVQEEDDARALRIAESSRARVLAERLDSNLKPEPLPDLASLKRLAQTSHSSLLSFWLAPLRSYAWLITAGTVRRFRLPPAGEIEKLVTAYRDVVEHSASDPILAGDPNGPTLWNALMTEIAPQIPKGSRVIVIPDGALHQFNLETLVAPSPEPHYWIEDVEIAVAPSIAIAARNPPPPAGRTRSVLLIGDPDYAGSEYPPLKHAGQETNEIQQRFAGASPAVYTGSKALPAAYGDSNPRQFSFIHFAAHAEANREKPLESAVILSRQGDRYKLYAHEVIDIPIQADLVTISACKSAGIRSYSGEGLIGFAWAFLRAGARKVVAGLWDVSDTSTEPLMDRFYEALVGGQSPISAMRGAKLSLKSDPRFGKPYYWGPFQVYVASAAR